MKSIALLLNKLLRIIPDSMLILISYIFVPAFLLLFYYRFKTIYKSQKRINGNLVSAITSFKNTVTDDLLNLKYLTGVPENLDIEILGSSINNVDSDSGIIIAIPHFSQSLALAKAFSLKVEQKIYIPIKGFKEVDISFIKWLLKISSTSNCEFIQSEGSMQLLLEGIKSKGIVIIATDILPENNHSCRVRFFNEDILVPTGAAWLAQKTGAKLLTGYMTTPTITKKAEIYIDRQINTDSAIDEINQEVFNNFERYIKQNKSKWSSPHYLFTR